MKLRAQVGQWNYGDPSPDFVHSVHGLDVTCHGGECCGVKHLYNFPMSSSHCKISATEKSQWLAAAINRCIDSFGEFEDSGFDYDSWRAGIEVVLSEHQLSEWCRTLEEAGFKQVFSFLNHNSGNECHVFFLETNRP